jgi:hypothetical protein
MTIVQIISCWVSVALYGRRKASGSVLFKSRQWHDLTRITANPRAAISRALSRPQVPHSAGMHWWKTIKGFSSSQPPLERLTMTLEPKRLRSFILQICRGRLGEACNLYIWARVQLVYMGGVVVRPSSHTMHTTACTCIMPRQPEQIVGFMKGGMPTQ